MLSVIKTIFFRQVAFLLLAFVIGGEGVAGNAQPSKALLPFFLGQHIFYIPSYSSVSLSMFSGIRIWGNDGTTWSQIESSRGQYDFSILDSHVSKAYAKGFDIIYTLGQTPLWAAKRPSEKGNMGLGTASEPKDMQDWARYVREVAQRYKGRIHGYEVMNEPRIPEVVKPWSPGFFSGPTSALGTMTRIAAEEIKKIDQSAQVICPAMDGGEQGLKRLDHFFSTGAGKYCDVVSFHFYVPTLTNAELRTLIRGVKTIMAKHGLQDRPLWNTETGILIAEAGYNLKPREDSGALSKMFNSAEASRFAAKFLVLSQMLGVERSYWFAHDSSWMGSTIANKKSNQLNLFGSALTLTNKWLSGRTLENCEDAASGLTCRIIAQGSWVGTIHWGGGKAAHEWKSLGYKSVQFLNSEILNFSEINVATVIPRNSNDVVFLFR